MKKQVSLNAALNTFLNGGEVYLLAPSFNGREDSGEWEDLTPWRLSLLLKDCLFFTEAEPETEPEAEPETEPGAEPEAEPETEPGAESENERKKIKAAWPQVMALHNARWSAEKIAEELSVKTRLLLSEYRANNVEPIRLKDQAEKYAARGLSYGEIAKELGVTYTKIANAMRTNR